MEEAQNTLEDLKKVDDELAKSPIERRAEELNVGRSGAEASPSGTESPIEEAKKMAKELDDKIKIIKEENQRMERMLSDNILAGKSLGAGKAKDLTQDEKDDIDAKEFYKKHYGM